MNLLHGLLEPFFRSEEDRKNLIKVVIPSFFAHFLAALMALGITVFLTRILGDKGYGVYTYSFNLVFILVNLATFGICTITVREIPLFIRSGDKGLWKGFYHWGLRLAFFLCLLAFILLFLYNTVLIHLLHFRPETVYTMPIALASFAIPFFGLMNYYTFSVRGQHRTVLSFLPENIVKPVILIILLVIFRYTAKGLDLPEVIIFNIISFAGGALFIYLAYRSKVHFRGIDKKEDNKIWNSALRNFFLLTAVISLGTNVDVFILGELKEPAQVAIYNIASRIASVLTFFLYIINSISAPTISHLNKSGQEEQLQLLVTKIIRGVTALTLPIGIVIILFRHFILGFFGNGKAYISGSPALIILCAGHLVNVIFGPVGTVAMMTGNERYNTIFTTLTVILNIIIALILTPFLGFVGTAIAQAGSLSFWNIGMFLSIKKKVGIRTWIFG